MATKLPAKDVVIIGLGWTGAILAQELTDQGLDVVAIERGPWRDTATSFNIGYAPDELRYGVRLDLFQRPAQSTLTFRNNDRETALPIRQWGSFQPGNGVGGAGVHWGGQTWRHLPTDFRMRSHLTERYGASFIPDELSIQDWGVTYDEMEPFYDRFEYLAGISGKAGNLNGVIQAGGNPFEGPRKREYPLPPMQMTYAPTLFAEAARSVGYHPFPSPSANLSADYTNPLGIRMGQCTYLRLLRAVRLRQLLEGKPADLGAAGAHAQVQLRGAHRVRGAQGQSRSLRQACDRRDLRRQLRHRMGAARGTRPHLRLRVQQCAHDADLGYRPSLRSEDARGNGRPQLRLPDLLVHRALFRRQDLQSVHCVGRARAERG